MYKLLQVNSTANWGSTGKIAEQINLAAQGQGWSTYIAYGRHANASASELIRVGGCMSLWRHGLESYALDRHGLASRHATAGLVREIQRIRPDIIHLHNIHGYYLNYPILFDYLKHVDIPVVWTLHDCWAFTGHCSYFALAQCERWRTGCHDCPLKAKEYPRSLWKDRSRENFRQKKLAFNDVPRMVLVPASEWLARLTRQSFLAAYPIHYIHNGIDLNRFVPKGVKEDVCRKWGIPGGKKVVLGVASVWDARKGLHDMERLSGMLPDGYVIVLVGVTAKQQRQLPSNVFGICRTNDVAELAELYSMADIYVNPTYADTFPTTNLEALACGTPVATYHTGGSPEAVDVQTGVVVEQGAIAELATAIVQVCEHGKRAYATACRRRAERHFNKDERFAEYLRLYEELLEGNAHGKL